MHVSSLLDFLIEHIDLLFVLCLDANLKFSYLYT